jgi:hypothetical protein
MLHPWLVFPAPIAGKNKMMLKPKYSRLASLSIIAVLCAAMLGFQHSAKAASITLNWDNDFAFFADANDPENLLWKTFIDDGVLLEEPVEQGFTPSYEAVWDLDPDNGDTLSVSIAYLGNNDDPNLTPGLPYIDDAVIWIKAGTELWKQTDTSPQWDGFMPLEIIGNAPKSISHVAITNVPEGGATLALLGLALIGLSGTRKLLNK